MAFWLAAVLLALAVAGLMAAAALQQGEREGRADPARHVHAAQLREIERDAVRGVIAPDEAARLRAEVARRLIEAARSGAAPATRGPGRIAAMTAVAVVLGGGAVLYRDLGAPGYPDLPMSARLDQAQALRDARLSQAAAEAAQPPAPPPTVDAEFLTLMQTLRARVAERPEDLQGHLLLVENEGRLGNFAAAARAQADVIRIKGRYVTPEDYVLHARLMISAAGGAISPEAEAALEAALRLSPDSDEALFLIGLSHLRLGRPDLGLAAWARLIDTAPSGSEWLAEAQARIGDVAAAAGVDYVLPDDLRGPAAGDVEAATGMTPEARAEMVQGMVEGLAGRLATEGGSAVEWAQLVTSLAALGQVDRARTIRDEALGVFADRPDDLATIRAAAAAAGLGE